WRYPHRAPETEVKAPAQPEIAPLPPAPPPITAADIHIEPLELDRSALTRKKPAGLSPQEKAKLGRFYERDRDVQQDITPLKYYPWAIVLTSHHVDPEKPDTRIEEAVYQYLIERYDKHAFIGFSDPKPTNRPRTVVSVSLYGPPDVVEGLEKLEAG